MSKRSISGVNAGSMADIAFLLLIFFMMTATIEKDKGLSRRLPAKLEEPPIADIKEKNLLDIRINKLDELFVNGSLLDVAELRSVVINFIDNGGALDSNTVFCDFCQGARDPQSSDHPKKAVVLVDSDRQASYKMYITVQNEIMAGYYTLRNRESQRIYGWNYTEVKNKFNEGDASLEDGTLAKLEAIQELIPLNLIEAQLKN